MPLFMKGLAFAINYYKPFIPQLPIELQEHVHSFMDPCIAVAMGRDIRWANRLMIGHRAIVSSLKFNFAGTQLISGSYDGTVRVWGTNDLKPVKTIDAPGKVTYANFVGSESMILSVSSEADIVVIDDLNGAMQSHFQIRGISENSTATSVDVKDDVVVICSSAIGISNNYGRVALYNWRTGDLLNMFSDFRSFRTPCVSIKDNFFVAAAENRAYCYKFDDLNYKRYLPFPADVVHATAASKHFMVFLCNFAQNTQKLHVYDRNFKLHNIIRLRHFVSALLFDDNGILFGLFSDQYHFRIDVKSGAQVYYEYV